MYMYISLSLYIYIYINIYLSLSLSIYLSLSLYIYIYIYIHTYIHTKATEAAQKNLLEVSQAAEEEVHRASEKAATSFHPYFVLLVFLSYDATPSPRN